MWMARGLRKSKIVCRSTDHCSTLSTEPGAGGPIRRAQQSAREWALELVLGLMSNATSTMFRTGSIWGALGTRGPRMLEKSDNNFEPDLGADFGPDGRMTDTGPNSDIQVMRVL